MEQAPHDEAVYSKNVLEMLTLANEYTLFIEKAEEYAKEDILDYMQKIFPIMYLKACLLPVLEPSNEEAKERYVTEELWENIFNILRNKFQNDDEYWYLDNSDISETDPIKASLADNLSDIYQDLKDFVILYQKNSRDAKENAIYQCKQLFEKHWGYRIVNALKYLHYRKYKDIYPSEEVLSD